MLLTVIIPIYNEEKTIKKLLTKVASVKIGKVKKEIIVVNDGSTDTSGRILKSIRGVAFKLITKKNNEGKGAAIRTAISQSSGDIFLIQDADLEYDPNEYSRMLEPIITNKADVVFGSRFVTGQPRRVLYFWHFLGNLVITACADALTNLNLSDIETCYKAFTRAVARRLNLQEKRFGFEPEFTVKVAKMNVRIYEIGISYSGRSYEDGKKIGWRDGVVTLVSLFKYSLFS